MSEREEIVALLRRVACEAVVGEIPNFTCKTPSQAYHVIALAMARVAKQIEQGEHLKDGTANDR